MPERTCSIDGCGKKVQARGWCGMHYARWRKSGNPRHTERPAYTGNSYDAAHYRVEQLRGKATKHKCAGCAVKPASDWAFDHRDQDPLYSASGMPYSLDVQHYIPLCRRCHLRFDRLVARMRHAQMVPESSQSGNRPV